MFPIFMLALKNTNAVYTLPKVLIDQYKNFNR